jgi:Holliday junction resolvase RusA-like endonuclease
VDVTKFDIPGVLKGKARPRFVRATGRTYTPETTLNCEQWVKHCALQAGVKPLEGALEVEVYMDLPIPASWSKRKKADAMSGNVRPVGKPDLDNVLKLIGDALNGVAWRDDSQIVKASISRRYGPDDGIGSTILVRVVA